MARIIKNRELLRRGVGKFIRDLDSGYIIVSNEKVTENSYALLKARSLAELFGKAGMMEEKEEIENALKDIRERTSEKYRRVRYLRKS